MPMRPPTWTLHGDGRAVTAGEVVAPDERLAWPAMLALVGLLVDRAGYRVVEFLLPPVVTGAIVALIGLNLAPVAKDEFTQQAGIALVTLVAILIIGVAFRGFISRLSVFAGVVVGYVFAAIIGKVDWTAVKRADWVGFPDFTL